LPHFETLCLRTMETKIIEGLLWYFVFVSSTACHEASHAWSALHLGDKTAGRSGQISLNPWPHIRREPIGMVVAPLLSWFTLGWLLGWASAPFDLKWARQFPHRAALMASAGPLANLVIALLAAVAIRAGIHGGFFTVPAAPTMAHLVTATANSSDVLAMLSQLLSIYFSLNLFLCVLNFIPVPPLDGSSLPLLVLPERLGRRYFDALRSGVLQIIGLLVAFTCIAFFFPEVFCFAANVLLPNSPLHE